MTPKSKDVKLTGRKGWLLFAACWIATLAVVWGLRQALVPKDELDCYARVIALQKAVDGWNKAHPEKPLGEKDELDEKALSAAGFFKPQDYDREKHYHFIGPTVWGLQVKCNKHGDNPLSLRLTGVTLLALLVFVGVCANRGYRLFDR
jgi:hypothetical protein